MLANDIEKWRIGKALFMCADDLRGINPGENGCLSGSALRPALDAETRIGRYDHAVEGDRRNFILKNCQRLSIAQSVERIVRTARADAETVNEKKQNARIISHSLRHRA